MKRGEWSFAISLVMVRPETTRNPLGIDFMITPNDYLLLSRYYLQSIKQRYNANNL